MNTQQSKPKASLAKARALLGQNKIREALEIVETFTQENPDDAAGWALFASVMMTVNEPAAAVATIERALALNPDNASWQVLAAQAYVITGDLDRGESSLQKAVKLNGGKDAGMLCDAGYVFMLLQQHETANKLFTDAIEQEPEREIAHFNLGMNELALGNFKASEISLDRAIELDQAPYRCKFEAMLSRAGLRKQTEDDNHVAELKSELEQSLPANREPAVCYALAKELEDLEQYEESFEFCKRGADIRDGTFQYDVNVDVNTFDEIIETHTSDALRALQPGTNDPSPIFVMGLPRTGTTLTDRIISSHSEVTSAGEPHAFAAELVTLCQSQQPGRDIIAASLQLNMKDLGDAYVHNIRRRVPDSPRFIDKLPLNYHYCGLIDRALPNAKMVHLKRDPMDACYAIYKTLFKKAYPFSYDLDKLATYYIAYRKLLAHWEETLGDRVLHVYYEHLVDDPESESRRIIDFLDLEWQPAILDFHNHRDPSTTASAVQVRSPVHRGSVGKWKRYERQLTPLLRRLENAKVLDS